MITVDSNPADGLAGGIRRSGGVAHCHNMEQLRLLHLCNAHWTLQLNTRAVVTALKSADIDISAVRKSTEDVFSLA